MSLMPGGGERAEGAGGDVIPCGWGECGGHLQDLPAQVGAGRGRGEPGHLLHRQGGNAQPRVPQPRLRPRAHLLRPHACGSVQGLH